MDTKQEDTTTQSTQSVPTSIPTVKDIALAVDAENAGIESGLKPNQEAFCRYYTMLGEDSGNATIAYSKAYGYDLLTADTVRETRPGKDKDGKEIQEEIYGTSEYDKMRLYCQVAGSRLLSKDIINERVRALMLENFHSDDIMDARLEQIALKGKDTDAIQAIKHRNDLKQRITKKLDITTANRPLVGMSDEELRKLAGDE